MSRPATMGHDSTPLLHAYCTKLGEVARRELLRKQGAMSRQRAPKQRTRRSFGAIRQLPSGRYQATYKGPDEQRHRAPETFAAKVDAEGWLSAERRLIDLGTWSPLAVRAQRAQSEADRARLTVRDLCDRWLDNGHLKESTADSHRRRMELRVLCTSIADESVVNVDRARIVEWWTEVQQRWPDTGNTNSYAYKRLRTCFQFAVDADLISVNPVKIKGAGTPPRSQVRDRPLITIAEAQALSDGMSERLRAPLELLLWCGLRLGELLELRRGDIHGLSGDGPLFLRIRRNAERVTERTVNAATGDVTQRQVMHSYDTPKTDASNRDIHVPAQVAGRLREHCRKHVGPGAESLIVTTQNGEMMMDTSFRTRMTPAKRTAGRPDITPHDCRRFYGTTLVNTPGVTLEEARLLMGHETTEQLMEYQRAQSGYQQRAAAGLDALLVTPGGDDQGDQQDDGEPEQ